MFVGPVVETCRTSPERATPGPSHVTMRTRQVRIHSFVRLHDVYPVRSSGRRTEVGWGGTRAVSRKSHVTVPEGHGPNPDPSRLRGFSNSRRAVNRLARTGGRGAFEGVWRRLGVLSRPWSARSLVEPPSTFLFGSSEYFTAPASMLSPYKTYSDHVQTPSKPDPPPCTRGKLPGRSLCPSVVVSAPPTQPQHPSPP